MGGSLRPPSLVTIVAQKHNRQGVIVAANSAALGDFAVLTPGLVEPAAAHLAGGLVDAIQCAIAYYAGFLLQFLVQGFRHQPLPQESLLPIAAPLPRTGPGRPV